MDTSSILWLLVVAAGWLTVDATIPTGYILQIKPFCGVSALAPGDANITIVTDLKAKARAECLTGSFEFNSLDDVIFTLPISYPPSTAGCVMKEIADGVFTMKVFFMWGEVNGLIQDLVEQYSVTCSFEDKGADETSRRTVNEGLVAAKAIQVYNAPESTITLSLVVTDVLGHTLDSSPIPMGRKIRLRGSADSDLYGLHAVGCDAIGKDNNKRYAIIRAGCGDGIIFKKSVGFTTNNNVTWSPYFDAFTLPGNTLMSFECNFTTCSIPCNSHTCSIRTKRQVDENEDAYYILSRSEPIEILPANSEQQIQEDVNSDHAVTDDIMYNDHAFTEDNPPTQRTDQTVWIAIGFITILAMTSIFFSVCALVNNNRTKREVVQLKL